MIIDDLIVLGRACPELLKDGRVTVCLGGYSPSKGFIRLYPTRTSMDINRWAIVKVEVERDPRDTRKESWKIAGSRTTWDSLPYQVERVGELPKRQRLPLVHSLVAGCVLEIRDAGNSLGIVKPTIKRAYLQASERFEQLFQATFPGFGEDTRVKRDFPCEPKVQYTCSHCRTKKYHDQQILEWGFFKWFEKHPDDYEQVWENAKFDLPDYTRYFFVGNLWQHRKSFVVISVLRFKKRPFQQPLFSYSQQSSR